MSKTKDYRLVFDDQCPICRTYSKVFKATGFIDEKSLEGYQSATEETCILIDKKRACNEIALVNIQSGEVIYGVDSILKLVTLRLPFLNSVFNLRSIYWFLKRFYCLIAYNRKIILPNMHKSDSCVPDFNMKYRFVYLLMSQFLFIISWSFYFSKFNSSSVNYLSVYFLFQLIGLNFIEYLLFLKGDKVFYFNVLGNFSTVLVLTIFCIPIENLVEYIVGEFSKITQQFFFLIILIVVFVETFRRFKYQKYRLIHSLILPIWLVEVYFLL